MVQHSASYNVSFECVLGRLHLSPVLGSKTIPTSCEAFMNMHAWQAEISDIAPLGPKSACVRCRAQDQRCHLMGPSVIQVTYLTMPLVSPDLEWSFGIEDWSMRKPSLLESQIYRSRECHWSKLPSKICCYLMSFVPGVNS